MTARPHDALFKSAFEEPADAAALLCELVPPPVRAMVAWGTLEGERGSFVDPSLADQHSDLLFSAQLRGDAAAAMYFLLEHQSTSDSTMPLRVLSYDVRIWERFVRERPKAWLPPVVAVLVSHVRGGWTAPRAVEELFDPRVMALPGLATRVPRFSMVVEDLTLLSNEALAGRSLGAFQKLALWLLRDARDPVQPLASFEFWIPSMLELSRTQPGLDRWRVLITYLFRVIDPVHLEELRAKLRTLDSHAEEAAMTIAEYLHEEGRQQGLEEGRRAAMTIAEYLQEEGRQQGRAEGRLATLRSLLILKFHSLGPEHEARLEAATPEAIDRYLQRLLTADSLAAVLAD